MNYYQIFLTLCYNEMMVVEDAVKDPAESRLLRYDDVAQILHVPISRVRSLVRLGKLPCVFVGGRNSRRFMLADVQAFIAANRCEGRC